MNNINSDASASRRKRLLALAVSIAVVPLSILLSSHLNSDVQAVPAPDFDQTTFNFLPSDAYNVPADAPPYVDDPTQEQIKLARFAWQEFIALNWPSNYDTTTHKRGTPDQSKTVADFLANGATALSVWQTYKHRVEVYPKDISNYNTSFDTPPQYFYDINGQSSIKSVNNPAAGDLSTLTTYFNNLDETSEIDLATMFVDADPNAPGKSNYTNPKVASGFPGAPRRMIYEAKANRDMFEYVVSKRLYDSTVRKPLIDSTNSNVINHGTGAVYPVPSPYDQNQIAFPFGGGATEGSIEVKATWRQLTSTEYNSGKFVTSTVLKYRRGTLAQSDSLSKTVYYDVVEGTPTDSTMPYGLIGLHIIHKTQNYPSYVFATFEQVDNLNYSLPNNVLFFYNRANNPNSYHGKQYVQSRYPGILSGTQQVNDDVHTQIKGMNPNSVWQYYQLIGVQGRPENSGGDNDYLLSNIVTETNEVLRAFSGTLNTTLGTINPTAINLRQGTTAYVAGGCKGCHANAQDADFSFITKNAPIISPDVVNQSLKKVLQ